VKKVQDKLLSLKNDLVFQELLGNPKNKLITGHLLSLILNRKVSNVNLNLNKRMLEYRATMYSNKLSSGNTMVKIYR
jgi:hypothetical protein